MRPRSAQGPAEPAGSAACVYKGVVKFVFGVLLALAALLVQPVGARPFEILSALQSRDLVRSGGARLLDVRTVQEALVVGSPAQVPGGGPLGWLIPHELRLGRAASAANPFFAGAVEAALGEFRDEPVIVMCHTGRRAAAAALQLESMGFAAVFVMDDPADPANVGGFGGLYVTGYRGWPAPLAGAGRPAHGEATWLGSGLPVTFAIDPQRTFVFPPSGPGGGPPW